MKRTTKEDPKAIAWKKLGGGSFHANIGGKLTIVKTGQIFYARPDEIPVGFRDTIVPVDPTGEKATVEKAVKEEEKAEEKASPKYELQHRGGGWWNVVDEDGKVQNEKALKKEEAAELLNTLS